MNIGYKIDISKLKKFGLLLVISLATISFCLTNTVNAVSLSDSQVTVGATYYGGEYNDGHWIIDNTNQCTRIANGEFSAESFGAVVDSSCDDDNGLTYQNDVPLHNTVSFAELSNNPDSPDYSALGNLSAGTRVEIEYNGKCVVAEKRDVGTGGSTVNGHQRAIDLWWQTARSLGFTNGFDLVKVRLAGNVPLSPLGKTSVCQTATQIQPKSTQKPKPAPTQEPIQPTQQVVDAEAQKTSQENVVAFTSEEKPDQSKNNYEYSFMFAFMTGAILIGVVLLIKKYTKIKNFKK